MSKYIKSLGWFIRFAPSRSPMTAFYSEKARIPLVRAGGSEESITSFLWAGEAIIWEIISQAMADVPAPDPDTAPCFPIMRCTDIDSVVATYKADGLTVVGERDGPHGREAFIVDPEGHVMGLRQRPADSSLPHDVEARRRARRGEAFNPACLPLMDGMQELGWIVRRVSDVDAMTKFYAEIMDLHVVAAEGDRVMIDLGDNSLLELAPGGQTIPLPSDRRELPNTIILRAHDRDGILENCRKAGVHLINEHIAWPRGDLTYLADPDGWPIGVEQRHHPTAFVGSIPGLPEDIEAQRRWVETVFAGTDRG